MKEPEGMTQRERMKATIHFEKPDALPWIEDLYEETIMKWFQQGLPADETMVVDWVMLFDYGAILLNWPAFKGFSIHDYFGFSGQDAKTVLAVQTNLAGATRAVSC